MVSNFSGGKQGIFILLEPNSGSAKLSSEEVEGEVISREEVKSGLVQTDSTVARQLHPPAVATDEEVVVTTLSETLFLLPPLRLFLDDDDDDFPSEFLVVLISALSRSAPGGGVAGAVVLRSLEK